MKYKVTTVTEAFQVFDMLGIKNVSTRRQKKNGTQVYELPIQQMWQTCEPKPLRFACYRTGYVRNVSEYNSSAYQINKTKKVEVNEYHNYYERTERILIPNYDERIVYLANFILRNYYQKPTYLMNDYTIKCLKEAYTVSPVDDVQVIINGHRYNLTN